MSQTKPNEVGLASKMLFFFFCINPLWTDVFIDPKKGSVAWNRETDLLLQFNTLKTNSRFFVIYLLKKNKQLMHMASSCIFYFFIFTLTQAFEIFRVLEAAACPDIFQQFLQISITKGDNCTVKMANYIRTCYGNFFKE